MNSKKTFSILLLAILAAVPAFALEPVSKCDALAAWAAGLETLPADFASFTALEPGQRSAVYKRLSNPQRAALWQEQLRRELAEDRWNEAQRGLIAEMRALATTENLAASDSGSGTAFEAVEAALGRLEVRVKEAFPRAEAMRVFYGLGPQASSRIRSEATRRCDCTDDYVDLCGPIGEEGCVIGNCTDPVHCGFMWSHVCNGGCTPCMGGC